VKTQTIEIMRCTRGRHVWRGGLLAMDEKIMKTLFEKGVWA
jgi:hypothetical protein